jgi:hypothetical protein
MFSGPHTRDYGPEVHIPSGELLSPLKGLKVNFITCKASLVPSCTGVVGQSATRKESPMDRCAYARELQKPKNQRLSNGKSDQGHEAVCAAQKSGLVFP